jgi:nitrite reductase/ring-hydroxylating ferredoxin subunit
MRQICATEDIPNGSSRGFEFDDLSFFIVHHHQQFHAYINSCPHRGIELNWQPDQFLDFDGQLIQCGTHGALFLIENGRCVAGPCQDQHLKSLPIRIVDNIIYLLTNAP